MTPVKNDKGFHPSLPAASVPLRNTDGVLIKTYAQLDPQIRSAVATFIGTAVARQHVDQSWNVVAPTLKAGYTPAQWKKAAELPVVPYPGVDTKHVQYYLDYASTKEILRRGRSRRKARREHAAGHLPARPRARRAQPLAGRLLDAALDAAGPAGPVSLSS